MNKQFRKLVAAKCRKAAGTSPKGRDPRKGGCAWKWYGYAGGGQSTLEPSSLEMLMDKVNNAIIAEFLQDPEWIMGAEHATKKDETSRHGFVRKQFPGVVIVIRGTTIRKGDGPRERQEGRICQWVRVIVKDPDEACEECIPQTPTCEGCTIPA